MSRKSMWRVIRRVLLLFALGIFINSYPQWTADYSQLRIMGVLQRIALAYGVAAFIILSVPRRWLPGIGGLILFAWWGFLYFFGGPDYSLQDNATVAVDRFLLGESHIYHDFGIPFDPEGIPGSLPAAVTVIIGYLAGALIKDTKDRLATVRLFFSGAALTAAGYLWSFALPLNKPLWTSSYVLYTAGLAAIVFALFVYLMKDRANKKWPLLFSVFGLNPLLLFILSIIWSKTLRLLIHIPDSSGNIVTGHVWLYRNIFVPLAGNMNGSLLFALAHVALFWLIGYILYKRKIFIKV